MEIEELWNKYSSLLLSTFDGDDCHDNVKAMLDELGERIIFTPSARFVHEPGCYAGGMINIAMKTASKAIRLMEAYDLQFGPAKRSVIKVALLHDLDWHREKQGAHYKLNDLEGLQKMTVSHRTQYLLQHFGVKLDQDEWLGIQLAQGFHFEENRWYIHGEPELAMVVQHAKHAVLRTLSIHDQGLGAQLYKRMKNNKDIDQLINEFVAACLKRAPEELIDEDEEHEADAQEEVSAGGVAGVSTPLGTGPTYPSVRRRKKKKNN